MLKQILYGNITGIEHIGSTAIPNIVAKPVIDIALAVKNLNHIQKIIKKLTTGGYIYRDEQGISDRHLFVKITEDNRTHHIHLMPISHVQWVIHLLFRDYLIAHPGIAKDYEKLKLALKEQYHHDRTEYTKRKSNFIVKVIELSKKENKQVDQLKHLKNEKC